MKSIIKIGNTLFLLCFFITLLGLPDIFITARYSVNINGCKSGPNHFTFDTNEGPLNIENILIIK